MKYSASSITLAVLAATTVTGLSVEGARSIASKFSNIDTSTLLARIDAIEEAQQAFLDNQEIIFNMLATSGNTESTENMTNTSAIRIERTSRKVDHEDLDLFCLAKNVFHEASIEDELGMFAVAQVTINRVRSVNYPNKVCDVVMQHAQFSWTNDKKRRWTHPSGPKWDLAKSIASKVIKDGYRVPALQAALFYHADYTKPAWRDPNAVVAQVGTHIFYTAAR
jgi:spore germination cell wall hydrolase CwlJ-like protein